MTSFRSKIDSFYNDSQITKELKEAQQDIDTIKARSKSLSLRYHFDRKIVKPGLISATRERKDQLGHLVTSFF